MILLFIIIYVTIAVTVFKLFDEYSNFQGDVCALIGVFWIIIPLYFIGFLLFKIIQFFIELF